MPPDRDPFNPPLHAAIATSRELYIAAEDNLTHHLDAKDGRSVSRCGTGASATSMAAHAKRAGRSSPSRSDTP